MLDILCPQVLVDRLGNGFAHVFYKWNNLQDESPERSTNPLRYWEKIEPGTIGETLLNFACSIRHVTPVIPPP